MIEQLGVMFLLVCLVIVSLVFRREPGICILGFVLSFFLAVNICKGIYVSIPEAYIEKQYSGKIIDSEVISGSEDRYIIKTSSGVIKKVELRLVEVK